MAKNNIITINGNKVEAKAFDYNLMCDLEEMGAPMASMKSSPSNFTRAYIAICMGVTAEEAGLELQKYLIDGGKMETIVNVMNKQMEDSDFFQALSKGTEEKNQ